MSALQKLARDVNYFINFRLHQPNGLPRLLIRSELTTNLMKERIRNTIELRDSIREDYANQRELILRERKISIDSFLARDTIDPQ